MKYQNNKNNNNKKVAVNPIKRNLQLLGKCVFFLTTYRD